MQALQCRNGHRCYSAAERVNGRCAECGDESFSLVFVKEAVSVGDVVESTDGSVVATHRKLGTGYVSVVRGHGGMATVTTEAGSKYVVKFDAIEFLPHKEDPSTA